MKHGPRCSKPCWQLLQLLQFFIDGFETPNHLRCISLGYYDTTRQEFSFSKSTTEPVEHDINYVQSYV